MSRYNLVTAKPVLEALQHIGLRVAVVGGIKERGYSDNDIDILVHLDSVRDYKNYQRVMRQKNFVLVRGTFGGKGDKFWKGYLESWRERNSNLPIDAWLE